MENGISKKITYVILAPLFLIGAVFAVKFVDAEDDPIYRDGVCIDHCEEDDGDEDEENDEEDRNESEDTEKSEEKTVNETTTVTEPARIITNTVIKTRVIMDTDQDGIPDGEDPHQDIAEIYVVSDDDRDGISDWLEK
jgi:hypothetical protein